MKNTGKNQKNTKKDMKTDSNIDDKVREEKQRGGLEHKTNGLNTIGLASHVEEPSI